jgi:nucleoside-diphosphate-sugar epimerase
MPGGRADEPGQIAHGVAGLLSGQISRVGGSPAGWLPWVGFDQLPAEQEGAKPVVANVFDADQVNTVVADIEPEVAAAQRAGVRRVVAESVIFAYGYPTTGPAVMDETDPYPGPPPKGGAEMLAALRSMEQAVLTSGEHSDTEGIVLRYGIFYGPGVPHTELFTRLAKWWALPAMTGKGIVSWVHIDDVAKATAGALDHGRGGQIYNIVDDRPQSFGDYARELAAKRHRPRPLPMPHQLAGLAAPYAAIAFGRTWLPLSNAKAKAELGWTPIPR